MCALFSPEILQAGEVKGLTLFAHEAYEPRCQGSKLSPAETKEDGMSFL